MNIYVLDENYLRLEPVVDTYKSFIWTERYAEAGEFELVLPADNKWVVLLQPDRYLQIVESSYLMIIESVEIDTSLEDGSILTVKGRSLESLLDRRIIWKQTDCDGDLQNQIKKLLNENAISPSDSARQIPGLIFEETDDKTITDLTIDSQFTGDVLYDVICDQCKKHHIGWYIKKNSSNQLVFKLYNGVDRSYNQTSRSVIAFSPAYSNLINTKFTQSNAKLKNVALVGGEGEGNERKFVTVGDASGMTRRELFVNDSGTSSETTDSSGNKVTLSADEYNNKLKEKGQEELGKNVTSTQFDGEVQSQIQWTFRKDYFVGDLVAIENEYGVQGTTRITECAVSDDNSNGYQLVPTFEADEDENGNQSITIRGNNSSTTST